MVVNFCFGYWVDSIVCFVFSGRVIGRENCGGSFYDRVDLIIYLLVFGFVDEFVC